MIPVFGRSLGLTRQAQCLSSPLSGSASLRKRLPRTVRQRDRRARLPHPTPAATPSVRDSFVEPDVFHAPAIKDAVDHEGHPFHIRLHARAAHAIENDRPSIVFRYLVLDRPKHPLSPLDIGLA